MNKIHEKKIEEVTPTQDVAVEAEATAESIAEPVVEEVKEKPKKKASKPAEGHLMQKTVNVGLLNVRTEPNTSSPILRMLEKGTTVTVKSIADGWAELVEGNYVMAQYLD